MDTNLHPVHAEPVIDRYWHCEPTGLALDVLTGNVYDIPDSDWGRGTRRWEKIDEQDVDVESRSQTPMTLDTELRAWVDPEKEFPNFQILDESWSQVYTNYMLSKLNE